MYLNIYIYIWYSYYSQLFLEVNNFEQPFDLGICVVTRGLESGLGQFGLNLVFWSFSSSWVRSILVIFDKDSKATRHFLITSELWFQCAFYFFPGAQYVDKIVVVVMTRNTQANWWPEFPGKHLRVKERPYPPHPPPLLPRPPPQQQQQQQQRRRRRRRRRRRQQRPLHLGSGKSLRFLSHRFYN